MRNTLVLRVLGSLPGCEPGEPPPPAAEDADAGPPAASHMAETDAEPLMPSAPNLKTVPPPALEDPRRRGPSADAGGDEIVGDSMAVAADAWPAATVSDRRRRVTVASLQGRVGDGSDDNGNDMAGRRRRLHHDFCVPTVVNARADVSCGLRSGPRTVAEAMAAAVTTEQSHGRWTGARDDGRDGRPTAGVHLAVAAAADSGSPE